MNKIFVYLGILLLNGCVVGPNFIDPRGVISHASVKDEIWWNKFNDPYLTQLVEISLNQNIDLAQAKLRIQIARENINLTNSRFFPQINISSRAARTRQINNPNYSNQGSATLDANWEIDLFGSISRNSEGREAQLEASKFNLADVKLETTSQVATLYFQIKTFEQNLKIIQETIDLREKNLALVNTRFNFGLSDASEFASAKSDLASIKARKPQLEAQIKESIYTLAVLLGEQPGNFIKSFNFQNELSTILVLDNLTIPYDLIYRRPDLNKAVAELHAQVADIGVATAAFYPQLSLSGNFTMQTGFIDGRNFLIGPAVTLPIFNGDRLRSQLNIQKVEADLALKNYELTLLNSLEEVESAFILILKEQERLQNLEMALKASFDANTYAEKLYKAGLVDYFRVIQTQSAFLTNQDQVLNSKLNHLTYTINAFKALGGGW